MKAILPCAALVALALGGCSQYGAPPSSDCSFCVISPPVDQKIEKARFVALQQCFGGRYVLEPSLASYLEQVGQRLAEGSGRSDIHFEFALLNSSTPYAFSLPNGGTGITRGLLNHISSESELAAILAHEMAHACLGQQTRGLPESILASSGIIDQSLAPKNRAVLQPFSMEEESRADELSVIMMGRAGYDPLACHRTQERLLSLKGAYAQTWTEAYLARHSLSLTRVNLLERKGNAAEFEEMDFIGNFEAKVARLRSYEEAFMLAEEGQMALMEGDAETALVLAQDAASLLPNEGLFLYLEAQAQLCQGAYQKAIAAASEAMELNPSFYGPYLVRGMAEKELGNSQVARNILERSLEFIPNAAAHLALGEMDLQEGCIDSAVGHFNLASLGAGEQGQMARVHLTQKEMGKKPERYIDLGGKLDPGGYLQVVAKNGAPVSVENLRVMVKHLTEDGQVISSQSVRFPFKISSNEEGTVTTRVGPFDVEEEIGGQISLQIESLDSRDLR